MQPAEIDLRELPVWERPTLLRDALDRLPAGGSLTFITENEPRGLSDQIVADRDERYVIETRRVARRLWRVSLTQRGGPQAPPNHVLAALEVCPPFARLERSVLEELAATAVMQTGRRGETLVDENSEWPYIGMVTEGIVARAKGGQNERERERILYEIFPSELFGVAEYFDRGLFNAQIVVFSKNARIAKFSWRLVDDIAARYPQLQYALGVIIAQRLRAMNDTLRMQGSMPILARIARVLLPYAAAERGLAPAMASLGSITQSQIAAAAGTVKEVAARAIADLESRECLKRERGHIRYLDRGRLVELIRELS